MLFCVKFCCGRSTEDSVKRLVVLFCVATLLVLSLALPAFAAKPVKFADTCAAQNGQLDEGTSKSPKDDSCLLTQQRTTVNSQGNTVTFNEVTRLYPDG